MYGDQHLPTMTPMMPIAPLGVSPYGHPLTSFASISSLAQPMIQIAQSVSPSSSGGSAFMPMPPAVLNGYRSSESELSNGSSISPTREICETSSTSSSESTPASLAADGSNSKDRKRKGNNPVSSFNHYTAETR